MEVCDTELLFVVHMVYIQLYDTNVVEIRSHRNANKLQLAVHHILIQENLNYLASFA